MASRFEVISDEIDPFLARMEVDGLEEITQSLQKGARVLEAYAQSNAPWSDITGMARSGLYADVFDDFDGVTLELGHRVEYGRWLETIADGKYAVILPTLEQLGPVIVREAAKGIMGGGGLY